MKISKLKQMFSDTKNIKKNSKIASFLEDEITGIVRKDESFNKSNYNNNYNNSLNQMPHQGMNQKDFNNLGGYNSKESHQNTIHTPLPRGTNNPSYFNPNDDDIYSQRYKNASDSNQQNQQTNDFQRYNNKGQQDLILEENAFRILKPMIEGWLEENLESLAEKIIRKELKKYLETEDEDKYIRERNYQFDFQEMANNKNEEDYLRDKFLKETRDRIRYKYEK